MKQTLQLYIGGRLVDLDESTAIQFTYTADDLTNPTVVKNSFSKQLKLKGTEANNSIFGSFYRLDRKTELGGTEGAQTGTNFNPLARTPFVIYRGSDIVEQGYVKVDKVEREGASVTYIVSLYGGLGSFFYSLSYDETGKARKLSSLNFAITSNPSTELNFNITASAVRAAWDELRKASGPTGKWSVINFAPAYNGIPSGGNFAADKALIRPADAGLSDTFKDSSGKTFTTSGGWSLVELSKEYTEWETQDLRSYLQRPVVSMKAIIDACCRPENNGGYSVELDSDFFSTENPYYSKVWLTLPLLSTYELDVDSGEAALTFDEEEYDPSDLTLSISKDISETTSELTVKIEPKTSTTVALQPGTRLRLHRVHDFTEIVCQMFVYGFDGGIIHISQKVSFSGGAYSNEEDAEVLTGDFDVNENGVPVWNGQSAIFTVQGAQRVGSIQIVFRYYWGSTPQTLYILRGTDESNEENYEPVPIEGFAFKNLGSVAKYETTGYIRSGSLVTKAMLLNTEKTPADYLISYCKLFGLGFIREKNEKRIRIVTRNTLYSGNTETIDLQNRIDLSKKVTITPVLAAKKWYDFKVENEDSEFVKFYKDTYGRDYGGQSVNTGYNFNAEHEDVLRGNAFKGTAEVLEREKYFINITRNGRPFPSVSVDAGHTYQLYNGEDSVDINFPTPTPSDTIEYWNSVYLTYDVHSKAQFHEEENEAIESRDVLLFYRGGASFGAYGRFILSDDRSEMITLNGGEPCWLLNGGTPAPEIPIFGRYSPSGAYVLHSLDIGTPAEVDIPDISLTGFSSIYLKYWARYLEDRYDVDTKLVNCYVNLEGLQVGETLLRKFYYFDSALWVLNKITNFDLTSSSTVQCEFVKVKNKEAYTKGQESYGPILQIIPTSVEIGSLGTATVLVDSSGSWTIKYYNSNEFEVTPASGPAGSNSVEIRAKFGILGTKKFTFIFQSGDIEAELEVVFSGEGGRPPIGG